MSFNFKGAKIEKRTYTKESSGGGQNWDFKYRPDVDNGKGSFYFSNHLWEEMDMDSNGMVQLNSHDDDGNITAVALAVVDHDRATIKKPKKMSGQVTTKTRSFTNDLLESALVEAGVIEADPDTGNQYLKLEFVGNVEDATAKELEPSEDGDAVYEIVVDSRDTEDIESRAVAEEEV